MANNVADRRKTDRRFTDSEIEEILEYSRGYVNGAKRRQRVVGISVATLLGLTTLINYWIVTPLKEDIISLRHEVMEIDMSVRKHHEAQASDYVSKEDEEKVHDELKILEQKIDRIVESMLSGKNR